MTDSANVFIWGRKVGTIRQSGQQDLPIFQYDQDFLDSGLELSPILMPLLGCVYSFPKLMETEAFYGLPGLLADSLPDKFGTAVIRKWLSLHGKDINNLNAIDRLCITGNRGIGALEYVPEASPESIDTDIDVTEMARFASFVLSKNDINESDIDTSDFNKLALIGAIAGGARAKALISYNEQSGIVRPDQSQSEPGFEPWLIKFDGVSKNGDHQLEDPKQFSLIEYAYYLMAIDLGINMSECRLLEKDGLKHFITRRFDRVNGEKLHVQTLAAMGHYNYNFPGVCSYEQYADIATKLGIGIEGIKEIFRRMVFNVFTVNCDDHVKNFSFIMDRQGVWDLSPAYDLTFAYSPNNQWISRHQMPINDKELNITDEDLIASGENMGLTKTYCMDVINETKNIVGNWLSYADKVGIGEERANEVLDHIKTIGITN